MSEAALNEAVRTGMLLGACFGVLLRIVVDELVREFREWRRWLEHQRTAARCQRDWK